MKIRTIAYYRVSTTVQERKENSIISQKQLCRRFINTKNWTLIKEFEEAISAQSINFRVKLQTILKMAKNKEFDVLLIKDMTRLSRDIKSYLEIEEILHENNIQIIQVDFPTDILDNSFDRKYSDEILISNHIPSFMSKLEINDLVRKTRDGIRQRVKKHKIFNNNLYGYQTEIIEENYSQRKTKTINNKEAKIVKLIFQLYLEGWGAYKITKHLNEKRFRTRKNLEFAVSSVQTIIKNAPIYAGYYTYKTIKAKPSTWVTITPDDIGYETILSKQQCRDVLHELKNRSKLSSFTNVKTIFNRTGLIKCKDCGRIVSIISNRDKSRAVCSKIQSGQTCNRNEVSIEHIEKKIFRKFKRIFSSKEKITNIISLFLSDGNLTFQTKSNLYEGIKAIEVIMHIIQLDVKFELQIKTAAEKLGLLIKNIHIKKYTVNGQKANKIDIKYSKLFQELEKYSNFYEHTKINNNIKEQITA